LAVFFFLSLPFGLRFSGLALSFRLFGLPPGSSGGFLAATIAPMGLQFLALALNGARPI